MTEADYQHECSRAELLGLPKPDREEFFARERETTKEEIEKEMPAEQAEDEGVRREGFQRVGGGLEELNSILSSTQKKLNRFKMVCGSFSNLLKLQIGAKREESDKSCNDANSCSVESGESGEVALAAVPASEAHQNKKEGSSDLEKLDSLISKAEKAELSLSSQNKQMRKYLN